MFTIAKFRNDIVMFFFTNSKKFVSLTKHLLIFTIIFVELFSLLVVLLKCAHVEIVLWPKKCEEYVRLSPFTSVVPSSPSGASTAAKTPIYPFRVLPRKKVSLGLNFH